MISQYKKIFTLTLLFTSIIVTQGFAQSGPPDIPFGAVVAFDRAQCPQNWEEYEPAYGRFIRGIDASDQNIDPDGRRVHGTLQEDGIKKHSHKYIRTHSFAHRTGNPKFEFKGNGGGPTFTPTNTTDQIGAELETRPKNVALLYCRKIGPGDLSKSISKK